jgi:sugar phosphate isomerase/epimerase
MAQTQIGAQMFTLRDYIKTPEDIAKTLKRVKEMGYDAIQVSAFGPIDPPKLAKIMKEEGLTCAATHVSMDFLADTQKCLDYHKTLGCDLPAIGGCGLQQETQAQPWIDWAKRFNDITAPLAEQGYRVGYHNHAYELMRYPEAGEKTGLELIQQNTGDHVWFEIDTYWIAAGGGDPAAYLRDRSERIPAIHVKDMAVGPGQQQKMCEVGSGNLNWPAILQAAKDGGTRWYLVERDRGDMEPFQSLKVSLDNLKAMGLS